MLVVNSYALVPQNSGRCIMTILGWILIGIGAIGLIGHVSGGGSTPGDPLGLGARSRFIFWCLVVIAGGALLYFF
jgi:uncharacterized membrane protein YadS